MCGRKTLTVDMRSVIEELAIEEWEDPESYIPSYNIAPTQVSPVLIYNKKRIVKPMRWGLIPSWAKDAKFASKMINARIETLTEKPSYRKIVHRNRCIVIANGYYEWKTDDTGKTPYYLKNPNDKLLPMAGLYDVWKNSDGRIVPTYTIITKSSQEDIAEIHDRMPVILSQNHINKWIDADKYSTLDAIKLASDTRPDLDKYPVSSFVNNVRNNSEICITKA